MPNETRRAMDVRGATADDAAFIDELAARFGAVRAVWREQDEVVAGTRRQLAAALLERRKGEHIFVAVDGDGRPAGFAYVVTHNDFFTGEPHGHLSEIATVADAGGVGSALMAAAEAWCRESGFRYLSLNVNDANENARRFYERRAFVPEYRHLVKLLEAPPA